MLTLLYIVEVIACLLLAFAIMLQKPKEGGLGGVVGGSMGEAVFGADAGNILVKVTTWLAVILLANTLLIARVYATSAKGESVMSSMPAAETQVPAPVVPQMPASAPAAPAAK
jgi:protein translocase SecG subunit